MKFICVSFPLSTSEVKVCIVNGNLFSALSFLKTFFPFQRKQEIICDRDFSILIPFFFKDMMSKKGFVFREQTRRECTSKLRKSSK